MTPRDFFELMQSGNMKKEISLPFPLELGTSDILAAELILWLIDKMPEGTIGDINNVLDSAKFWHIYWSSVFYAKSTIQGEKGKN